MIDVLVGLLVAVLILAVLFAWSAWDYRLEHPTIARVMRDEDKKEEA